MLVILELFTGQEGFEREVLIYFRHFLRISLGGDFWWRGFWGRSVL